MCPRFPLSGSACHHRGRTHNSPMILTATFQCQMCGALNEITADPSGGRTQTFTEDCQNCCRPHTITLEIDWVSGEPEVFVTAEPESDFF